MDPTTQQTAPSQETDTIESVPPIITNVTPPQSPFFSLSKVITITISILFIISSGAGGYLLGMYHTSSISPQKTQGTDIITPAPSLTIVTSPLNTLQTYTDTFFHFQYPSSWKVTNSSDSLENPQDSVVYEGAHLPQPVFYHQVHLMPTDIHNTDYIIFASMPLYPESVTQIFDRVAQNYTTPSVFRREKISINGQQTEAIRQSGQDSFTWTILLPHKNSLIEITLTANPLGGSADDNIPESSDTENAIIKTLQILQ